MQTPDLNPCRGSKLQDYVFMFAYESPFDVEINERKTTPWEWEAVESFGFYRVRSSTKSAAASWGREIADWYVMKLFGDTAPGRWSSTGGQGWIDEGEHDPLPPDTLESPILSEGHYPSFQVLHEWLAG